MSKLELGVTVAATIIGPVVAVLLSVWMQSRMEARQREFQTQFAKQTEEDRRRYEMTKEDAQARYIDAWKVADRDRANEIKNDIKRIADALEKEP